MKSFRKIIVFSLLFIFDTLYGHAQSFEITIKAKKSDHILVSLEFWKNDTLIKISERFPYKGNNKSTVLKRNYKNKFDSLNSIKIYFSQLNKSNSIFIPSIFYSDKWHSVNLKGSQILKHFDFNKFITIDKVKPNSISFNSTKINGINDAFFYSTRRILFAKTEFLYKNVIEMNISASDTISAILFYDDQPTKRYNNSFAFDFNKVYSKLYTPNDKMLTWEWYTVDSLRSFKIVFIGNHPFEPIEVVIDKINLHFDNSITYEGLDQFQKYFYLSEDIKIIKDKKKLTFNLITTNNPYSSFIASNTYTFSYEKRVLKKNDISFSIESSNPIVVKILGSEESKTQTEYPTYDYSISKNIAISPNVKQKISEILYSEDALKELRIIFIAKDKTRVQLDSIKFNTESNDYLISTKYLNKIFKQNSSLSFDSKNNILLHPNKDVAPMIETWGLSTYYLRLTQKSVILFLIILSIALLGFLNTLIFKNENKSR